MCFRNGPVTVSAALLCSVHRKSEPPPPAALSLTQRSRVPLLADPARLCRNCSVWGPPGAGQPERPEPGWSSPRRWQEWRSACGFGVTCTELQEQKDTPGPPILRVFWMVPGAGAVPWGPSSSSGEQCGPRVRAQPLQLVPAVRPRANYLTSLSLSYLVCRIKIIKWFTSKDWLR